jgi:hypothetical protein
MQQVVETMLGTAAQASCDLSFHPSPEEGAIVGNWDHLSVEQVVMNLLSNAFRYGAGQPVTLSLARGGDQAIVEVRDHGPGVPAGDLDRIFERFERATAFQSHGGLVLGLYVAREIVNAHGGSIAARTLPDGGACFTIRLPLA